MHARCGSCCATTRAWLRWLESDGIKMAKVMQLSPADIAYIGKVWRKVCAKAERRIKESTRRYERLFTVSVKKD